MIAPLTGDDEKADRRTAFPAHGAAVDRPAIGTITDPRFRAVTRTAGTTIGLRRRATMATTLTHTVRRHVPRPFAGTRTDTAAGTTGTRAASRRRRTTRRRGPAAAGTESGPALTHPAQVSILLTIERRHGRDIPALLIKQQQATTRQTRGQ